MLSFSSTSDKVLSIILENQGVPLDKLIDTIQSRLKILPAEIDSALAKTSSSHPMQITSCIL